MALTFGLRLPELLILAIVAVLGGVVMIYPATRICRKAGFSPWLGIGIMIPIANLMLLWFLALAEWPARRDR